MKRKKTRITAFYERNYFQGICIISRNRSLSKNISRRQTDPEKGKWVFYFQENALKKLKVSLFTNKLLIPKQLILLTINIHLESLIGRWWDSVISDANVLRTLQKHLISKATKGIVELPTIPIWTLFTFVILRVCPGIDEASHAPLEIVFSSCLTHSTAGWGNPFAAHRSRKWSPSLTTTDRGLSDPYSAAVDTMIKLIVVTRKRR